MGVSGLLAAGSLGTSGAVRPLSSGWWPHVVTEVFFEYQPVFVGSVVPSTQLYYQSFNRPRSALILQFN